MITIYYNPYENSFVSEQNKKTKLQRINDDGEIIEINDPQYKPFIEYSKEKYLECKNLRENYKYTQVPETYIDENGEERFTGYVKMIPPDENAIAKQQAQARIAELKAYLAKTDYQAIKFAEGELSAEDYAEMKAQRAEWRKEINELEALINGIE